MKLIFLDIDGVLNRLNELRFVHPDCVRHLNQVLAATEAKVCLSSSWRHLLIDQDGDPADMTLRGFATMLRTHGVQGLHLIDHIGPDVNDRGLLMRIWLRRNQHLGIQRYVAVDDNDHQITDHNIPLVQTDSYLGLTVETAAELVRILNRSAT